MAVTAISMRRMILGEGNFVESFLGRALLVVLFTSLVGVVLTMVFLVNRQVSPVLLKYGVLAALGLATGFSARRLLPGRKFILRLSTSIFALFIALGILNVLTLGFIGLNLLRAYPNNPDWDGALSLGLSSLFSLLALQAWSGQTREIIVEPRSFPTPQPSPAPTVRRPVRRPTRSTRSSARTSRPTVRRSRSTTLGASTAALGASFAAWRARTAAQLSTLLPAPSRGTTTRRRRTTRKVSRPKPRQRVFRRTPEVYLSSEVEQVCPYCLEKVLKNDRRGVKICKVCKTWHHADCWAITGVCQVPHQYVN